MNDDDRLERAIDAALDDGPPRTPPPERVVAVRAQAAARARAIGSDQHQAATAARRRLPARRDILVGGVAASIGAIAASTGAVIAYRHDEPDGPPLEAIAFQTGPGAPAGIRTEASVIDHTWGMELVLDIVGIPVGIPYDITYIGADGTTTPAGSFLAVAAPMHCRFNAARLRNDTAAVAIADPTGTESLRADLA